MIGLPENDPVCIAIEREERATGEEKYQPGGTPHPQAAPPCPRPILCCVVSHDVARMFSRVQAGNQVRETRGKRVTRVSCSVLLAGPAIQLPESKKREKPDERDEQNLCDGGQTLHVFCA